MTPHAVSMDEKENIIQELTEIELNNFFKNLWVIFLFLSGVSTLVLSFVIGIILFIFFFFLLLFIGGFTKYLLTGNGDISGTYNILSYFIIPFIIFSEVYGFRMLEKILNKINILEHIRKDAIELYRTYRQTLQKTEWVEEILTLLEDIQTKLFSIKKLLWFRFLFSKSGREKLKTLLSFVVHIALDAIKDLKENLSLSLVSKQRDSMEAIANLHLDSYGNEDLKKIVETQSIRLESQKEQFENLQKILVRI